MKNIKVSNYLHFQQVEEGMFIGWNRFYPSIFILNTYAMELLDSIKKGESLGEGEEITLFLKELFKYKFIYRGNQDPSYNEFLHMLQHRMDELEQKAKIFYEQEEDYDVLRIVNDACNLNCSYCVNYYHHPREKKNRKIKNSLLQIEMIDECLDQFFHKKLKKRDEKVLLFFNGGEILLDWDVIKHIVERISCDFSDFNVTYEINTNFTLLNEEIAEFFHKHNFKVNISIDGYKSSHDKSRVYRNGKGSFDDILEKVKLYRNITGTDSPKSFQGTIADLESFEPEEVYKMENYGFHGARLAPNLLNTSVEDAKAKASLMGKFLEMNASRQFQVKEFIFTRVKQKINQDNYYFDFNCRGLSGLPRLAVEINISNFSISHLCGFIHDAAVPFRDLGYNIYNPKLWQVSFSYIKERMDSVLKNCMECPLVGLCAGGCILSGIDSHNELNKAACAYQKEIWSLYLKRVYQKRKKK